MRYSQPDEEEKGEKKDGGGRGERRGGRDRKERGRNESISKRVDIE